MKRISTLILIIFLSNTVFADEYVWQGIKVYCDATKVNIKTDELAQDEKPKDVITISSLTRYFGAENKFSCELQNKVISGVIKVRKPSSKGMCGGNPGAYVSISINNTLLFNEVSFSNDCYESLDEVSFEENEYVGFVFKFCGHSAQGSPNIKGCFEFDNGSVLDLKLPFSTFPISDNVTFPLKTKRDTHYVKP